MLLLSFGTRELVSDKKDFSSGILRQIEVSSAGQVLLDHHLYGHDIHAKETIQLMGSGLISISIFMIIDFPNKIEEEQSPPLPIHLLNKASTPALYRSPLQHL